ncbi:MAG: UDP-2,4-diacetamido-2,4,6-trideoxy-beta-L-altropyranose hydrolase [bacterium]
MRSVTPQTHEDAAASGREQVMLMRVDAGETLGLGHAMRCLALAQAWRDRGGVAVFVMAETTPEIESRIRSEGCGLTRLPVVPAGPEDTAATVRILGETSPSWVVLDGYRFGAGYQRDVRTAAGRLLVVDDFGQVEARDADIVVDQNLGAGEDVYNTRHPSARLLLGPRYAMLRREFLAWQGWQRSIPALARTFLVTFGGGDAGEMTLQAVRALSASQNGPRETTVVVGGSRTACEDIRRAIDEAGLRARVEHGTPDMPALMAWADLGLTAAGSTVWEAAFMGLPSLLAIRAPNQRAVGEELGRAGVAALLGPVEALSPSFLAEHVTALARDAGRRSEMARRGRDLVDGDGAARVVMMMRGDPLRLRTIREGDRRVLWEWANDPDIRAVSFTPDPIAWESHVRWFESRLRDPRGFFYIGVDQNDESVGQIRFDRENEETVVSVSIDRARRGRGYGALLIELASRKVLAATGAPIRAYVKPGNQASMKTFRRVGYREAGAATISGQDALVLVFSMETRTARPGRV